MPKLILTTACATAVLSLAACGYDQEEYNEANATYNAEESNYVADNMTDYNDMNMDMDMDNMADNAIDNGAANAADNAAGNEATENRGY